MGSQVELSHQEIYELFSAWGFEPENGGSHLKWSHPKSDSKIVTPRAGGTGVKATIPHPCLAHAAKVVGVSLHDFKQGPPSKRETKREERRQRVGANGWVPADDWKPEPLPAARNIIIQEVDTRRPREVIRDVLRDWPTSELYLAEIVGKTGLKNATVSRILGDLVETGEMERIGYGRYRIASGSEKSMEDRIKCSAHYTAIADDRDGRRYYATPFGEMLVAIELQRMTHVEQDPLRQSGLECICTDHAMRVHRDKRARIVLQDQQGILWLAVPVNPDFQPLDPDTVLSQREIVRVV